MLSPELARLDDAPPSDGHRVVPFRRPNGTQTLGAALDALERDMLIESLKNANGNISETARTLGLTRRGVYLKMRKHGLHPPADMDTK
jgi:transcriptional regulator of acetoin/glycerol metabolism